MIQGLLTPKNFLDIVQNFTIYELDSEGLIKRSPATNFRALQKMIEHLKAAFRSSLSTNTHRLP